MSSPTGPAPVPATSGSTAYYTIGFTTSSAGLPSGDAGGVLTAGSSTITLTASGGTVWPATPSAYTVDAGYGAEAASAVTGGGSSTAVVTTPVSAGAATQVTVVIQGVVNPVCSSTCGLLDNSVGISTSSDVEVAFTSAYSIVAQETSVAAAAAPRVVPPGAGDSATYAVTFTTSGRGSLPAGTGSIALSAVAGTVFPTAPTAYSLSVAGRVPVSPVAGVSVSPPGGTVQVVVPVSVPASTAVTLTVTGVANPAAGRNLSLSESTSSDVAPVSSAVYAIVTGISTPALDVGSTRAGSTSVWGASFSTSPSGALVAGQGAVFFEAPSGSTLPADVSDYTVSPVGTTALSQIATAVAVDPGSCDAPCARITVPSDVAPSSALVLTIAGALAPPAGPAGSTLWTSADPAPEDSNIVDFVNLEPGSVSGVTATPGSSAAGVSGVTYAIGFETSPSVIGAGPSNLLSGSGTITLTAPSGTVLPPSNGTNYVVDGVDVTGSVNVGNNSGACASLCRAIVTVPLDIAPSTGVSLSVEGVANPSGLNGSIAVSTSTDAVAGVSNPYVIGTGSGDAASPGGGTGTGLTAAPGFPAPSPDQVSAFAQYGFNFSTSAAGALDGGSSTLTLTAAIGTVFAASSADYTIDGVAVSSPPVVSPNQNSITLTLPGVLGIVPGGSFIYVDARNVTNPPGVSASDTWSVSTSADQAASRPSAIPYAVTARSTSVSSLSVPAISDDGPGAPATYSFSFDATTAIPAGAGGAITVDGSVGAPTCVLPATGTGARAIGDFTVNGVVASTVTEASGPTSATIFLNGAQSIAAGQVVTVVISGVTNPTATGDAWFSITTSSDAVAAVTPPLTITSASYGLGLVSVTPNGASRPGSLYSTTFSVATALPNGTGTLMATFAPGTMLPAVATDYVVNGVVATAVSVTSVTAVVSIPDPGPTGFVGPNGRVTLSVAGVGNPPGGTYSIALTTSEDPGIAHTLAYNIGSSVTGVSGPAPDPATPDSVAVYSLSFAASTSIPSGGSISIESVSATTFSGSPGSYSISVNGGPVQLPAFVTGGGGPSVNLTVPLAVPAGSLVSVVASGVVNPPSGRYVLEISTSSDIALATTPEYLIGSTVSTGGVTIVPSVGGEIAGWSIVLTTTASGTLVAGTGTIALSAPAGTVFPTSPGSYAVSGSRGSARAQVISGGGSETVTIVTPISVDAASAATISVTGVVNPPAGAYSVAEWTSTDPVPTAPDPGDSFRLSVPLPPEVASVFPVAGPSSGGAHVTITGANFVAGSSVFFGSARATDVVVESPTTIRVISPPGTTGTTVDVSVVTAGGASPHAPADHYSYNSGIEGYWLGASNGMVYPFGTAGAFGDASRVPLASGIIAITASVDGQGYWLLGGDGGVFCYGDAGFYGSTGGMRLARPAVGMAPTPDGKGYWFVASDGGVFAFGDAGFYGSMGGIALARPVVGIATTPDGKGYWLVASDGGIFAFGDATFYGSTGAVPLVQPVRAIAVSSDGKGYWLAAADGGIFSFGDAYFYGSAAGTLSASDSITGFVATSDARGYWLAGFDGNTYSFGDAAPTNGNLAGQGVTDIVGIGDN